MKRLILSTALLLSACAPSPVVPDGMILVPKAALSQVLEDYTQQRKQLQELQKLREWRDSMFF